MRAKCSVPHAHSEQSRKCVTAVERKAQTHAITQSSCAAARAYTSLYASRTVVVSTSDIDCSAFEASSSTRAHRGRHRQQSTKRAQARIGATVGGVHTEHLASLSLL